jgi:hypothetical protein
VLFVIDFSGSMTGPFEGPNDPGDNCGRMRAVQALMEKFKATPDGVKQRFGLVSFSNDARIKVPFGDHGALSGTLNPDTWCGSDGGTARTNYKAAFDAANAALDDVEGRKIVYFISDGSPTLGGGGGLSNEAAGLKAAEGMRKSQGDDLTFYAVFLGYQAGAQGGATNPQGYLEQLTGDKDRVRVVGGAEELVLAVQELTIEPAAMKKSSAKAQHTGGGADASVPLASFGKSKKRPGRFAWMTEPLTLRGEPGATTSNVVTVTASSVDGEVLTSVAEIAYTVNP